MIEVVIAGGKSGQIVALNNCGVDGIGRKQSVARHQVIGGPQDSVVQGKYPQKGKAEPRAYESPLLPALRDGA
jgi:hypothetical protein